MSMASHLASLWNRGLSNSKTAYSFWNRSANREFKQQRWPRLRKLHLKNAIALLQTFSRLFHLVQFVKCWRIFLESNSKSLFKSSGKRKESRCLVFMSNTKREICGFHVPHIAVCFPHKILLKNCFQSFKGRFCKILWGKQFALWGTWKSQIRHFHVLVVQWWQRNVPKTVLHLQSFCFAKRN